MSLASLLRAHRGHEHGLDVRACTRPLPRLAPL